MKIFTGCASFIFCLKKCIIQKGWRKKMYFMSLPMWSVMKPHQKESHDWLQIGKVCRYDGSFESWRPVGSSQDL